MKFDAFSFPGRRSNVMARKGMVATSQPLASQTGLTILQSGGNAIDAAIATVATLCVVEPTSTGIGGDAFALIWWADEGKLYGINASGPAPDQLNADWLRQQGYSQMPQLGPLSVTVPGSLRGWQLALDRFGTMKLSELLQRPILYARDGFPVSELVAHSWQRATEKMSRYSDSRRVWLPDGRAPQAAEVFRNPEFATTLQVLAEEGITAFYQGDISQQIVETVQTAGGVLTQEDLAAYRAEWIEPITAEYRRGYTFHEIPPNGQGVTALLALNIARGFDIPALDYGSATRVHVLIEAIKLAFADAHTFIGDPHHETIPLQALLSESYASQRRASIQVDQACTPEPGNPQHHGDTVYLTVADGEGNMVSWIQSLYMGFGSGLTAGTTGVQLQNRGANFNLIPGHPNEVAPGKRPYHTIIPGFITKDSQAWASFGVMGGFMQPQGHLQVGSNLIDYQMDPQAALDAPRFRWLDGKKVALEEGFPEGVQSALQDFGHTIASADHYGGGQVIIRDPDSGVLIGGSDPRKDGAAVGW